LEPPLISPPIWELDPQMSPMRSEALVWALEVIARETG
jgi:hypothetical protein